MEFWCSILLYVSGFWDLGILGFSSILVFGQYVIGHFGTREISLWAFRCFGIFALFALAFWNFGILVLWHFVFCQFFLLSFGALSNLVFGRFGISAFWCLGVVCNVKGAGVNAIKLLFSSPLTLRQKRAFVLGNLLQENLTLRVKLKIHLTLKVKLEPSRV